MESIDNIIINQINKILNENNQNTNDFTITSSDWKILISRNNQTVTINYKHKKICSIVDNTKSWLDELKSILEPLFVYEIIVEGKNLESYFTNNKNITVKHKYNGVFNGVSVVGSKHDLGKITSLFANHENLKMEIMAIRDSLIIKKATDLTQTVGTHIARMGADRSSSKCGTVSPTVLIDPNVYVFVVDTGIFKGHPDLNIYEAACRNFINSDPNDWSDGNGHGTHVSGIIGAIDNGKGIVGIAPNVKVVAVRVLDPDGSGYISDIIAGLNYVVNWKRNNPTAKVIINMSLGGSRSFILDNAVQNTINAGIVVVVAAGNSGMDANNMSPARVSNAITVGAYNDTNNTCPSWTNYGTVVDVLAPGVNIDSTFMNNGYAVYSGTSMASPMVAGTVAILMTTNPSLITPLNIRNKMVSDAATLSPRNYDTTTGNNINVILTSKQRSARTTRRSVYSGVY